MLAAAEILSIKELAEIVAYITYLRRRKLVTDYLLKEGIGNDIEGNPFCSWADPKRLLSQIDNF